MTRVLIITGDPIGPRMAGPAIRAWNMALLLAAEHEVTLVTTTLLEPVDAPFRIERVRPGENAAFAPLEAWAEVIVFQGHALTQFEALRSTETPIVADIYDPMHIEMLEQGRELGDATWNLRVSTAVDVLNDQLRRADFLLCASERQRLFYLGQLAALGRLSPATYRDDPHLERLLAIAPFGLSADAPRHTTDVVKGVRPGIGPDDRLVLWGGGLYSWFDPITLISAIDAVWQRHPDVRLLFLGTRHPGVDEMGIVRESFEHARRLGALDRSVFFNETWVQYEERSSWLLEADAGASTHHAHLETTFAFRTRILDYLWAGLPMVVTEGDSFADLVAAEGLGVVVADGDVAGLAAGIERVLYDAEFRAAAIAAIHRVRERFFWEHTLRPLVEFVRAPHRAADRPRLGASADARARGPRKPYGIGHDLRMTWHYLRSDGVAATVNRVTARLRRHR